MKQMQYFYMTAEESPKPKPTKLTKNMVLDATLKIYIAIFGGIQLVLIMQRKKAT